MIRYFALVAENEIFYTLMMDEDHPIGAKWSAALQSGVVFVKMNDFSQVKPGFFYKDGYFYDREDPEMLNPILEELSNDPNKNQYAGIIENDVIGIMTTTKENMGESEFEMVDAGVQSNPLVIEYTNNPKRNIIRIGWLWDGNEFYIPGEK